MRMQATWRCRMGDDEGSALVEFVWLTVLLMVPLVYIVLSAVSVQRDAFGLTAAARDAGRAYATAGSDALGEQRAEEAVALAMHDQGVTWHATGRVVVCGPCTYAPGSTFTVRLTSRVALPLVPSWLCGHTCVAGIGVSAQHSERLSCFSGTGIPDPDGSC
jgi:Flp pilus assembly protein TadG